MSVFFINPFLEAAGGDYESIATVTVGSGGASNIEFTSIPSTYQHLQIRGVVRGTTNFNQVSILIQVNGNATSSYATHGLMGGGSSATALSESSVTYIQTAEMPSPTTSSSMFGAIVCDILDYASTSKTTTLRVFAGADRNGSGQLRLSSGLWNNTAAISSVKVFPDGGNLAQHSTFALYGIKAP